MPTLSWNTIRARAARFADEWRGQGYEKGQTQRFYLEFFGLFDFSDIRRVSFEAQVKKLGNKQGFIDLFWPGMLLVEQKSIGRDLGRAKQQALDYFPGLADAELPRYLLLSDFQSFELYDLPNGTEVKFPLSELPAHIEAFAFIRGDEDIRLRQQEAITQEAARLIGRLHDLLAEDGFGGQDLQVLLIRLVFCLFADDTGIFDLSHSFHALIRNRSASGGRDLGRLLMELFEVLNTPPARRQAALDEELAAFPYINGALFEGPIRTPVFDHAMREALLAACRFDWKDVSPAIFGSLFQSIMDKDARRQSGAHYTGEAHILRVIGPLFLDELTAEFDAICARKPGPARNRQLHALHDKLARLTLFDPACGCGNFLVVAYQRLRQLETAILKELHRHDRRLHLNVADLSRLDVDQFYGIELGEFAARIAQVALWMVDHLANLELSAAFGDAYARIPLNKSAHIHCMDALEADWQAVLPAAQCSYVLGNPPFVGKSFQSAAQSAQLKAIAASAGLKAGAGTLDYVCAWFLKAAAYVNAARCDGAASPPRIGFVATNSITQGEQVAQLWPLLFERWQMEIAFAHRTFNWTSEASGAAHVHVVIIGLAARGFEPEAKRLFDYPEIKGEPLETRHAVLSPYLIDAGSLNNPHSVVAARKEPLNGAPKLKTGVQMIDNGLYTFTEEEKTEFLQQEPDAAPLFKKFIGGDEYINGYYRWILYLANASPALLRKLPCVLKRMAEVQKYRHASNRKSTQSMSQTPTRLGVDERLTQPFLVIPNTSSEQRDYIPIGWLGTDVIANQKLRILPDAQLWHFAILTSRMHMAWMRLVTGRMKSDYMYSVGVVYNAFPWPPGLHADAAAHTKLTRLAHAVLNARAAHPGSTLADLYHATTMPPDLRKAHSALDKAVDRLYCQDGFKDDRARVAHLLARYEALRG